MYKLFVEVGLVLFSAFVCTKQFALLSYFVIFDRFASFGTAPSGLLFVSCLMSILFT